LSQEKKKEIDNHILKTSYLHSTLEQTSEYMPESPHAIYSSLALEELLHQNQVEKNSEDINFSYPDDEESLALDGVDEY
jgi:hypothetical protein